MIEIERISRLEDLAALREPWEKLLESLPFGNVFLSPDWIQVWWTHRSKGRDLWILVGRENGRIVGIAPLVVQTERWRGLPVRRLSFIQERAGGVATYSDILCAGDPGAMLNACIVHIAACPGLWDVAILEGLQASSPTLERLAKMIEPSGLSHRPGQTRQSYVLPIQSDWDAFCGQLPRAFRKNLRAAEKRLHGLGAVKWERVTEVGEMAGACEEFCDLEARSVKGPPNADEKAFYLGIATHFAARGRSEIRFLRIDGKPVAGTLCLISDGTLYGLKTCYDLDLRAASPGVLHIHALVKACFEMGLREIDFMGNWFYLSRWTRTARTTQGVMVYNRRLMSQGLRLAKALTGMLGRIRKNSVVPTDEVSED